MGVVANVKYILATSVASSRSTPLITNIAGRRAQALRESTIDPQLGPRIKIEPNSRSATPGSLSLDAAALHRSYAPPMQSWPMTPYGNSPMAREPSLLDSLYSTPSSDLPEVELPRRINARSNRRNLSGSNGSLVMDDELEFDDGLAENTKLKGVYWDGMGMFDSATPEMRRKRNQKKATSVVQQLQVTSEVVEATECVFDAKGELRRERPITGNPESDDGLSPLPGESTPETDFPPKKKRPGRRPRPALVEKHVNTGRALRRRGDSHHPPFNNSSRRGPYFDGPEDEDDQLTYGRPRPKKRTGLSIHRDNTGPDITFDQPAPMNTLTAGFRDPFQAAPLRARQGQDTYQNGVVNRNHRRQASFPFGAGFRSANDNPLGIPPPNFGSFGQLNGQSMFKNNNFHNNNPFSFSNGNHAFAAFQQQFGIGQQLFGNDSNMFQAPNHVHTQNHNPWDLFGFGQQDMGFQTNGDAGFHMNADLTSVNPLFFSSNQGGAEDDEATVSAPPSEH